MVTINTLNGGNITVTLGSGGSTPTGGYWSVTAIDSPWFSGTIQLYGNRLQVASEDNNATMQYDDMNKGWQFSYKGGGSVFQPGEADATTVDFYGDGDEYHATWIE